MVESALVSVLARTDEKGNLGDTLCRVSQNGLVADGGPLQPSHSAAITRSSDSTQQKRSSALASPAAVTEETAASLHRLIVMKNSTSVLKMGLAAGRRAGGSRAPV